MEENQILLSICVPTYNRASFLEVCLINLVDQIQDDMPVEILVSDNFSTDNSLEIASKYESLSFFKLIKQETNIGPMRNALELISKHAKGKFCWFVGDDDYVVPDAVKKILSVIKLNKVDFIFLNVKAVNSSFDINQYNVDNNLNFEYLEKFESLLLPKYSQIFAGELMASIFKRNFFLKEKSIYNKIDDEYLSTLETSYLHCVIFANQFMGKPAVYINDIMILADSRAREWSDKSSYLVVEQLYNLLMLYKKNGLDKSILRQCEFHYINISIGYFFKFLFNKKLIYRNRISINRYFIFLVKHPILTTRVFIKKIMKLLLT